MAWVYGLLFIFSSVLSSVNANQKEYGSHLQSVYINAGESHTFDVENIGYLIYSVNNSTCNIDMLNEDGWLRHVIGTDQAVYFTAETNKKIKVRNGVDWGIRFILIN